MDGWVDALGGATHAHALVGFASRTCSLHWDQHAAQGRDVSTHVAASASAPSAPMANNSSSTAAICGRWVGGKTGKGGESETDNKYKGFMKPLG
eukprot:355803-Chlamydomonas_euryale.AAC.3